MEVTFNQSNTNNNNDNEIALEALRRAINDTGQSHLPLPVTVTDVQIDPSLFDDTSRVDVTEVERYHSEIHLLLDQLRLPGDVDTVSILKEIQENTKKQASAVSRLISQLVPSATPDNTEHDTLQAKYDALLAKHPPPEPKPSRKRPQTEAPHNLGEFERTGTPEGSGRKKRSIRLEHLIHRNANRRLGVEYLVARFETRGTSFLPSPETPAPGPEESINSIQEFRPQFGDELQSATVAPYIEKVVEDVMEFGEWDRDLVEKSVGVYWTRLSKRYDEQLARERGEVHKDELTRRKQNQYRRQQSLLARRQAAFDLSPLNHCKLRALYRTLLTIDFVTPTNERPDTRRNYTAEQWEAYRRLALGGMEGYEVVDLFWLSPVAKNILNILDVSALDQASRLKRKGRPKAPAETFHLPPSLWDRSVLPTLRPADYSGLPQPGAPGIVLFRFAVDEDVQKEFPDWAEGLYDTPPIGSEDSGLPSLGELMQGEFIGLTDGVKRMMSVQKVGVLSDEEVVKVNSGEMVPPPVPLAKKSDEKYDQLDITSTEFIERNIDSFVALAEAQEGHPTQTEGESGEYNYLFSIPALPTSITTFDMTQTQTPTPPPPPGGISINGMEPITAGTSAQARKMGKRGVQSELPSGAVMPVPKRRREVSNGDVEVDGDVRGDAEFLAGL